jgi:hypothetical protein
MDDMRINRARKDGVNGISMMDFFSYRLQYQDSDGSKYIFKSGRLFQQLCVDMYAAMEMNTLNWIRNNQKTLRAELYQGMVALLME